MKTVLILVRHGEARGNIDRIFHGFTDSDLTENGRLQVMRAAQRLREETIDYFYSSDLKRAYETALTIAEPHGGAVIRDERFREIDGGKWENIPWDDLPSAFPESYAHWLNTPYLLQMPAGESMEGFYNRLVAGITDLLHKHAGKTVLLATHGTAIRVMCAYFKGLPLSRLTEVAWCDNAAITKLSFANGNFTFLSEGDNTHLGELSTMAKQDWWKKK